MQTSTDITSTGITSDPRPHLSRAVTTALGVVDGVAADQLHLPTPCRGFDVEQLLGHLAFALGRVAAAGRGEEISPDDAVPRSNDWGADLRRIAADAIAAWADDARLDSTVTLPWAVRSGAETVGIYVNEVTVHTWDLATATGQLVEWDDDVVALAFDAMQRELPMPDRDAMWAAFTDGLPEGVDFAPPFANARPVAPGASPIDRLLAWNGR